MKSLRYNAKTHKLFIIGIDGGTFDLILPWVKQGRLPNFARLIREGVHGPLQSTIHPLTPTAWSTFMTGKNPGKHGIFDFVELGRDYDFQYTYGGKRKCDSVWKILSNSGKKLSIINLPYTYPPEKINGFVISGYDARVMSEKIAYPQEIYKAIYKDVGKFSLWSVSKIRGQVWVDDLEYEIENKTKISKYLLSKYPVDVFMVCYSSADIVQHMFFGNPLYQDGKRNIDDIILHIYKMIDESIGELLQFGKDATIMIVSDHGGHPIKGFVNLNMWLNQLELLKYKNNQEKRDPMLSIFRNLITRMGLFLFTEFLPYSVADAIRRSPIQKLLVKIRKSALRSMFFSNINWAKTKAFSWEPCGFGNIQINMKGVFQQGIVERGVEYEDLRETIIKQLEQLKDPVNGEFVIEKVFRREDVYHGKFTDLAPDLIVIPRGYAYTVADFGGYNGQVVLPHLNENNPLHLARTIAGCHHLSGIFICCGEKIKRGIKIQGAKIENMAPTILHLMGTPIPSDMDGRVLEEIFE